MTILLKIIRKIEREIRRLFINNCYVFLFCQEKKEEESVSDEFQTAKALEDLHNRNVSLSSEECQIYNNRFSAGDLLFYKEESKEIVAYGWKSVSTYTFYAWEINKDIHFEKKVSVLYDFYVDQEHRGKGVYTRLLRTIIAHSSDGEKLAIFALSTNTNSLKGIKKAGFKPWFSIKHFGKTMKGLL